MRKKMGKRKGKPKAKTKEDEEELPATSESINPNCDDQRQCHKVSNCRELARTFVSQKLGASGAGTGGHETKLVRNSRSKSCKANWTSTRGPDDSFERQLREKLEQVGASSDNKPSLPAPPLISISIAPATAQGSRSASCATTTNSTWSLKSIGKQREHLDEEEEEAAEDGVGEPPDQVEVGEQLISRLGSVSSCEVFAPSSGQENEGQLPLPTTTTSGLELVRKSYIRLVRHNSLQYFYLGTLIYSVICMILLPILLLLRTPPKQPPPDSSTNEANNCDNYDLLIEFSETRTNIENKIASGGGGGSLFLISLVSTLSLVVVIALKFFIEFNRQSEPARWRQKQQKQQQAEYLDTPTEEPTSPRGARINNTNSQPQTGGHKILRNATRHLPHYLQVLAIHLSLWLIICPVAFLYYITQQNDQQRREDQRPNSGGCDAPPGQASVGHNGMRHIPIIVLSVALYLLPHLMSETLTRPVRNHLRIFLSTGLPPVVLILLREKLAEDFHLTLTMTLLASLAGQLRHAHLMKLVRRDTFAGASDLIEAKVSLEQQRQQQETLLLSVLPAYVAEQVKRTMVKKMESVRGENDDGDDQQQQAQPGASLNNQDNANQQQQVLVSTTNATTQTVGHGPAHCGRSLTLTGASPGTELQVQSEPLPNNGGGGAQLKVVLVGGGGGARDQRHSFARASRLSSSLASGAAYISEALLNNVHPTGKSSSTTSSAVQVTSSSSQPQVAAPTALLPALSNSLNTQQQSRRGFNELYIRTYNNVSLLYGDIVGFTRLCTQLSSSQLVRVLNNLFSHFDHLAERHRIMRIKILGDCYYGVSGIPEFAVTGAKSSGGSPAHRMHKMHPTACGADKGGATSGPRKGHLPLAGGGSKQVGGDNHAVNCVYMGLDMIQYIKRVNIGVSRPSSGSSTSQQPPSALSEVAAAATAVNRQLPDNFELNMRIGIHTGHIHSGVIGLKKWQFDVWSNDVSIAMHCESSGVAGRVQVTEATAQHLRGAFTLEPACTRTSRDTFLADRDINTYLIKERVQELQLNNYELAARATPTSLSASESAAAAAAAATHHQKQPTHEMADEDRIREATIGTIQQTLLAGNGGAGGDDDGDLAGATPLSACGLAELERNDIRWLGLTYRDSTLNKHYDERQVCARYHLFELLLLFVTLALALHLIDYLTLVAPVDQQNTMVDHYFRLILLGSLLVGLCLLIVALPKPGLRNNGRSSYLGSSRAPSLTQQQQKQSQQPQQQHNHKSSGSFMSSIVGGNSRASQNWSLNDGDLEDPLGGGGGTLSSRSSSSRLVKLLSELPMARKWCRAQQKRSPRLRAAAVTNSTRFTWLVNNRLTSGLILLAFLFAVASQAHLIAHHHNHLFCLGGGVEQTSTTNELRQMTILIVLMALDLSPSLWGYRTRCCLLVCVFSLQVACLAISGFTGGGDLWSKVVASDTFAYFQCPDPVDDGRDQPTGGHSANNENDSHLIDLASDALLLVVALWSLAYQRQVECAQRCNFLWRNRLNVDHEELEYISGINKVLLENILPSHVVQHYLAQPQAATSGPTATQTINNDRNQQAANSSQKHKRTASETNLGKRLAKSPSVASSASTQLVRMSVGCPMRGPLHSVGAMAADGLGELYHEQHDSVAVMFASIPHFYEFYDESDISKQGLGCIALLNEIICDFDKLLLKNKFSRIEKIKTIGSTYMAAAGLRPSGLAPISPAGGGGGSSSSHLLTARNSTVSQVGQQTGGRLDELNRSAAQQQHQQRLSQQKMNLICMIQFATSLMSALNGINKQSFQVFKLRVGVNAGPVIAGIIGAQRPFYDIWGDCVNIASRMESLGEVGRIQVEERTAKLLMECLCNENYVIRRRGPIDVKGKGGMVTYFVDKKELDSCSRQSSTSIAGAAAASATATATATATARQQLKQQEKQQVVAQVANKQPSDACAGGQSDDAASDVSPAVSEIRQQQEQQVAGAVAACPASATAAPEINGA